MKRDFRLTLVDPSESMLAQSRRINPELEHLAGDMRDVRLGRLFDAVFIHDAIDYMVSPSDLRLAMQTAYDHCRPGGVALFMPDHVEEKFFPFTDHGGADGDGRAMRFLEWSWDPVAGDQQCVADYTFALRDSNGNVRVVQDRHVHGLFPRQLWLDTARSVGFDVSIEAVEHSELEPESYEAFVGVRP